jgi:hypothetical protein
MNVKEDNILIKGYLINEFLPQPLQEPSVSRPE